MSIATIVAAASVRAQNTLAQTQGMTPEDEGNFLYAMEVGIGVFGSPLVVEIPQGDGGYRRRVELPLTVTRDQEFNFEPKTKLVRLASNNQPATTYTIDKVDIHDPLIWTLTLVRTGGG